jgi:hypothetical protein
MVELNTPEPPVLAAGAQPETVPFEVTVPVEGVFVTGGLKVDVPFRTLQLLAVAAPADGARATAEPVASESAKATDAILDRVFMRIYLPRSRVEITLSPITRR